MSDDTVQEVDHRKETARWTRQVRRCRKVQMKARRSGRNGRHHPGQAKEGDTEVNAGKRQRQRQWKEIQVVRLSKNDRQDSQD